MQQMQQQQVLLPNQPQGQQNQRCVVYIDNLDQGITEDYLFHKFKEVGSISNLKIIKEKQSQKSRGQAFITYTSPDSAEEARRKFDNQVFIKNNIRVKPYINIQNVDKNANIFIQNIPDTVDVKELEQIFSAYGNVQSLEIKQDQNGKSLGYGYIQFEKKDDVEKLITVYEAEGFTLKDKPIKLERFKGQSERKIESATVYFRAFARPLTQELQNKNENQKLFKAYEWGWISWIKHYFTQQNVQVKDCFAKLDENSGQPWAMIQFAHTEDAKKVLDECERTRFHDCIRASAQKVWDLISNQPLPLEADGSTAQFQLKDAEKWFKDESQNPNDVYKGSFDNFFFNSMTSKHLNQDERLVLVQNIREDVTKELLEKFLSIFGRFVRLTVRQNRTGKIKLKQCYVHYQTLEDSKKARSEIYENPELEGIKKEIFENNRPFVTILMPKSIRKEFKQIKNNSQVFQTPANRKILIPFWQQPMLGPPQQFRQGGPMPQPGGRPYVGGMPPDQRGPQGMRPQYQQRPQAFSQQQRPQRQMHPQGHPQGQMNPQFRQPNQYGMPPQGQFMNQQLPMQMPMQIPNMNPMNAQGYRGPQQPMAIPQQQMQAPRQQQQFTDYQQIKNNMPQFSSLTPQEQRHFLGLLLLKEVQIECPSEYKNWASKITGMLMDEEQFEIEDILNFLDDKNELQERVQEAIQLILDNDSSQP